MSRATNSVRVHRLLPLAVLLALTLAVPRVTSAADLDLARLLAETNNLQEIQARAGRAFAEDFAPTLTSRDEEGSGYLQYKRWEWFVAPRVYPSGELFNIAARNWQEYHRFLASDAFPAALLATVPNGSWEAVGPTSYTLAPSGYSGGLGRVNAVAFDSSTVLLGTPSGGLWRFNTADSTWKCLTDGLPSIGASGIAVNPASASTIYILTGDGDGQTLPAIGVLKSTDSGTTWLSTGLSWPPNDLVYGYKLVIHPTNPAILFAVTTRGIYRTTDAGVSWTNVRTGDFRDLELKPGAPATVYAATTTQIFRSTDTGATWSQLTSGLPTSSPQRIALAVSAASPATLYALYGGGSGFMGLYRSQNSGDSFALRSNTPNLLGYSKTGNDTASQAWYDLALAASPANADQVHVGGVNTWKSTDGGATWVNTSYWVETQAGNQYTHADIHALEFQGATLYCGSDGGIFKTSDGAATWTNTSNTLQIMQINRLCNTPQNAALIYLGAQDNGANRIGAGPPAKQAVQVYGADGGQCQIDYANSNNVYVSHQEGGLLRSTDGGSNFTTVTPSGAGPGGWVTPYVMHPTTPGTLFAGYTDLWTTTNSGGVWTNLSNGNVGAGTAQQVAVARSNTSYLWVVKSGAVYSSTNGGSTWSNKTGALPVQLAAITDIAVSPSSPQTAWVTFSGYSAGNKIFKTTDGGTTWTNVSGNLPNLPASAVVVQSGTSNGVYVGMDVGVYYRDDTTTSWLLFMNGLPNVIVNDLEINPTDGKIYAASYGRGVWKSDLRGPCPASYNLTNVNTPPLMGITTYQASDTITSAVALPGGLTVDVRYRAGSQISLQPGFQVEPGASFQATVGPCNSSAVPGVEYRPTAFRGNVEAMFRSQ